MFKKLLLALPLLLVLIPGAHPQTAQFCPNQAPGTNNNTCANTAFVQTAVSGGGALTLPDGKIFIGSALNVATAQSMSGDCTITRLGVMTCTGGSAITALTGDVTASGPGSAAATLATVNSNVGSFGSATQVGTFTVNAKGLITAASNVTITGLTVPNGGTGQATFSSNLPLIGNGTGAIAQGTRTGNTTVFATTSGSLVDGNCIKVDASGNLVDNGSTCGGGGGTPGGSNTQVQFNNSSAFGGSANLTWVSPKLTIGAAGSVVGQIGFLNATSGGITLQATTGALGTVTVSLPAATDTLVGKATTDTLTNKTFDTAGTGNVFKIDGTTISSISGNAAKVVTTTGALTNGDCVSIDSDGNFIAAGGACTTGGGGGTVAAATVNQLAIYTGTTTVGGLTNVAGGLINNNASGVPVSTVTPVLGLAGTSLGTIGLSGNTSGVVTLRPLAVAGTTTITFGNTTGTVAAVATAPLALDATTGTMSITGVAGQVLGGTPAAFTATPTLGAAAGTTGKVNFAGTTSGTVGLTVAAAAGTWTLTLPTSAGSSGQVLSTNGSGVTSWIAGGSGTVTSVATGTGLTGGPITTTGTVSLATIVNNRVLGNVAGSTTAPIAITGGQVSAIANDVIQAGTEYGVVCDGSTVTTTAFNNAIAGVSSTRKVIQLPAGDCIVVAGSVSNIGDGITIRGSGPESTRILTTSTTGDILSVTGSHVTIENVGIGAKSTTTRTSGACINNGGNNNLFLNLFLYRCYGGVLERGGINRFTNIISDNGTPAATSAGSYAIKFTSGGDSHLLTNWVNRTDIGNIAYCVEATNTATININSSEFLQCNKGFYAHPGAGEVVLSTFISTSYFDTVGTHGIHLNPSSTGNIITFSIDNSEIAPTAGNAFYIEGNGASTNILDVRITNNIIFNYAPTTNSGIIVGSTGSLKGVNITGNTIAGFVAGISIAANTNDFSITNNFIGNYLGGVGGNTTPVNIAAGTSNRYILTLNQMQGNTNAYFDGGSGVTKVVANNICGTTPC